MSLRVHILLLFAVSVISAAWFAVLTLSHPSAEELSPTMTRLPEGVLILEGVDSLLADELGARLLHIETRPDGSLDRRYAIPEGLSRRAVERSIVSTLGSKGLSARRNPGEETKGVSLSVELRGKSVGKVTLVPTAGMVKGLIALVIDDFGYRFGGKEEDFLKLHAKLAMAVIPGHPHSREVAMRATEAGMEVLVHLPMEPEGYVGGEDEYILLASHGDEELRRRIQASLAALPEARGLNNHMGSKATSDPRLMSILAEELRRADKYFLDSATSANSVAALSAGRLGVPYARRAVFLDNPGDDLSIQERLAALRKIASRQGAAVGIGHSYFSTLAALRREIPRLEIEGFRLVFPSDIVRQMGGG